MKVKYRKLLQAHSRISPQNGFQIQIQNPTMSRNKYKLTSDQQTRIGYDIVMWVCVHVSVCVYACAWMRMCAGKILKHILFSQRSTKEREMKSDVNNSEVKLTSGSSDSSWAHICGSCEKQNNVQFGFYCSTAVPLISNRELTESSMEHWEV